MSNRVSIGEFSRLTHLSVKALRHYHTVGVLSPAMVDTCSGYRYYDLDQLTDAHLLRRLRELDMPLEQVKKALQAKDSRLRERAIGEHLKHMEAELERTRDVVTSLRSLLDTPQRELPVKVVQLADLDAIAIVQHVVERQIEDWSNATFEKLDTIAECAELPVMGPPGSLFPESFFIDGEATITAFLPVKKPRRALPDGCQCLRIPGGQFATATHRGQYTDLDRTYAAVGAHVNTHFKSAKSAVREHYVVGPVHSNNPQDWTTELMWPLE